jgi:hypothetical protein
MSLIVHAQAIKRISVSCVGVVIGAGA